ncbi:MAG: hypothetical protein ACI9TH_000638 [Kiritimatiellia bacterium]|jgi:hypothetical protein
MSDTHDQTQPEQPPEKPHTPIAHPAVWRGDELMQRADFKSSWTQRELKEFEATLRQGARKLREVNHRMQNLSIQLEEGCGAVWIKGLLQQDYSEDEQARHFLSLCSMAGNPLSQNAEGDLMMSVRDAGYGTDDARTRGPNTRNKLSYHTDRCDVIAFMCLQPAQSGGENQLVSSMALYNHILATRPDLLDVLMHPFPYKRHNVDAGNAYTHIEQPIFAFCEGHFACSFLRVLIDRADADPALPNLSNVQREALDYLETCAERPELQITFRLEAGDMLFLNNWVSLHRRTAFTDYLDETKKRHLLRVWLSMPNSRPLDPAFAANFGSVAAGAIRGGMPKS